MNGIRVIVRGGGDIATGTIYHLYQCGFQVLILECAQPTAIRRKVAFCEAVYDGTATVEGVCCRRISDLSECDSVWVNGELPLLIDPAGDAIPEFQPSALVDAILAKQNLGTNRSMAPLTIALGPGFTAGEDVDAVIETMRGHTLGRVIRSGPAIPNTNIPGLIGGFAGERVLRAPDDGVFHQLHEIGDLVEAGETVGEVNGKPMVCTISGVLRGILADGTPVFKGMKSGDVDPRAQVENCYTASDKAIAIGGGVLQAILEYTGVLRGVAGRNALEV